MDERIIAGELVKMAKMLTASKTVVLGPIRDAGTHILGELWYSAPSGDVVGEEDFDEARKALSRYFDAFKKAKKSVCLKNAPMVYYSKRFDCFYAIFDFDAIKGKFYPVEERIEEIRKMVK